jgi:hypothetical protein
MHQVASDVRQTIIDRLRQGHGYDDPQRPRLLRELVEQEQRARNKATGYSIAAYDPAAAFDSVAESLSLSNSAPRIDRAVLLSDGAERAVSPFGLCSDWSDCESRDDRGTGSVHQANSRGGTPRPPRQRPTAN